MSIPVVQTAELGHQTGLMGGGEEALGDLGVLEVGRLLSLLMLWNHKTPICNKPEIHTKAEVASWPPWSLQGRPW